ncbi:MAG: hypothetical protein ACRBC3_03145 [Burkholderiaceae bacterium]
MTDTRPSRNRLAPTKWLVPAALCILMGAAGSVQANEYPTLTRVEYVDACTQQFDRPRQELIYKCSCAIDKIAATVNHDTWIGLQTFNNAAPIAGERGAYLRERKDIRSHVKHYRALQSMAREKCFLPAEVKR